MVLQTKVKTRKVEREPITLQIYFTKCVTCKSFQSLYDYTSQHFKRMIENIVERTRKCLPTKRFPRKPICKQSAINLLVKSLHERCCSLASRKIRKLDMIHVISLKLPTKAVPQPTKCWLCPTSVCDGN